ncbi:hypothetical protein G1H11_12165 [Phytoactinopolyspora alkaliphila]|uniref:HTH luxR-type domain-containing protein n=1 Tax=Phytoactinopolyspora alkaliphila TaxID=1783498 RepID=A0A6N9YM38_9ACTN|nr:LuxR C-terminal-related transcriptional regulator [Phytoactinopolyspora alkaliphila]NED96063.1 hypothetical protein [Phytoactinopolyspora alkaliphila]
MSNHATRRTPSNGRGPNPTLSRNKLVHSVIGDRTAALIVCQGPAGLGKSSLLDEIARQAGPTGHTRIGSDDELATHLRNIAAGSPPARMIVLDDASAHNPALMALIEHNRIHGTRAVVASSAPLAAVTPGMLLDGTVSVIGIEDLLFTEDDVAALAARYKATLTPDEVAALHQATDGWPAMVAAALRMHQPDTPVIARPVRELIARFVADELVASVPADELAAFTDAAAVPQIDAAMLATLLTSQLPGQPGSDLNPRRLIDRWAASGLLVHAPTAGQWRIPEPIRQHLLADLEVRSPGRRARLVTTAVQTLVAAGRTTDALPYLVEASLDKVVAGVLRDTWADQISPQGDFLSAGPAIRSLSDKALANDPSLLLISAISALRAPPDLDTFALRLAQADAVIERTALNGPLLSFHSLSMMLARARGDVDEANAVERAGQAYLESATDGQRHEHVNRIVYFTYQTGVSRLAEGNVEQAETAFRSAKTLARNNRADWYMAISERSLAYTSLLRGDLASARRAIESASGYARQHADELLIEHANLVLGLLELEHGRIWNAPDLLDAARGMLDRDAEPPTAWHAYAWSTLGLLSGDPAAAEQALLLSGPEHATHRLPLHRLLVSIARARAHVVHGDPKAALDELGGFDAADAPAQLTSLAMIAKAQGLMASGDPVAAARELASSGLDAASLTLAARTEWLAVQTECALLLGHDPQPSFRRLLALLERTGARRPILALPHLRAAVLTGKLAATSHRGMSSLGLELRALDRAGRDGPPTLTDREHEVMVALAGETTLAAAAKSMYVSTNTMKTVTRAAYRKLHAADRHEAVTIARALGLLDEPTAAAGSRRHVRASSA